MAHPRFSVFEKAGLWLFVGLGTLMVLASHSGSVYPLFGLGIIVVVTAILVLARRRSTEVDTTPPGPPYEHRGSAEFPNSADEVYRAILNDLQRTRMWRPASIDPNLHQIDMISGTDTRLQRAVTFTNVVTTIAPDRCRVDVVFRATTNSAVTSEHLAADFKQRMDKYLKVGLPLLLHNSTQHGSEERFVQQTPTASPLESRPQPISQISVTPPNETRPQSIPQTLVHAQGAATPDDQKNRLGQQLLGLLVIGVVIYLVLTSGLFHSTHCWPESKIRRAFVGNEQGISGVSITSTEPKACRFRAVVTLSYDGSTSVLNGTFVEGQAAVFPDGQTMEEP